MLEILNKKWKKIVLSGALVALMLSFSQVQAYGKENGDCCGCNNWIVGADLLYWQASETGLVYAIEETFIPPAQNSEVEQFDSSVNYTRKHKQVSYSWDPAFRIYAGYRDPCSCLDVTARWTRFSNKSTGSIQVEPSQQGKGEASPLLRPVWTLFNRGDFLSFEEVTFARSSSKWDLDVNVVDLELGKTCCCGPCFEIRPHVGVRFARISQDMNLSNFFEVIESRNIDDEVEFVRSLRENIKLSTKFCGAGARVGFDALYDLGCGFGVYGSTAGTVAYGEFDVAQTDLGSFISTVEGTSVLLSPVNVRETRDYYSASLMYDLGIGVVWDMDLGCSDEYSVQLKLGWENHAYLNQNQYFEFADTDSTNDISGNLYLNGFVLSAVFDF